MNIKKVLIRKLSWLLLPAMVIYTFASCFAGGFVSDRSDKSDRSDYKVSILYDPFR